MSPRASSNSARLSPDSLVSNEWWATCEQDFPQPDDQAAFNPSQVNSIMCIYPENRKRIGEPTAAVAQTQFLGVLARPDRDGGDGAATIVGGPEYTCSRRHRTIGAMTMRFSKHESDVSATEEVAPWPASLTCEMDSDDSQDESTARKDLALRF